MDDVRQRYGVDAQVVAIAATLRRYGSLPAAVVRRQAACVWRDAPAFAEALDRAEAAGVVRAVTRRGGIEWELAPEARTVRWEDLERPAGRS